MRWGDSNHSGVEREIVEMKEMVRRLTMQGTPHQVKACGICTDPSHTTDACPSLQEESNAEVNALGGYRAPRARNDPYSNNYNPGWKDHPNLRCRDSNQPGSYDPQSGKPSTEDILNTLTKHFATQVQTTESSIKNLEKQVGQLAEAITRIDARTSGNLPSQTVEVRKENVSC